MANTDRLFSVGDKVIVVTGGNSGLGQAIAAALRAEDAQVAVVGRSVSEASEPDHGLCAFRGDVSDETAVRRIFTDIHERLGRIDGLINCAGVYADQRTNSKAFLAIWRKVLDINLTGAAICANVAAGYMKQAGAGKIVNFGSAYSTFGHHKSAVYTASKTGIVGLSRALAAELGPWNICVNCVLPGWFDTKMNDDLLGSERGDFITNVTPLGRWGEPDDIAGLAIFLCSPASDFVTGAEIRIDGGYAISDRDYRHV